MRRQNPGLGPVEDQCRLRRPCRHKCARSTPKALFAEAKRDREIGPEGHGVHCSSVGVYSGGNIDSKPLDGARSVRHLKDFASLASHHSVAAYSK